LTGTLPGFFFIAWGTPFWPENRAMFDKDFTVIVDSLYEKVLSTEKEQENLQSKR
jgi:hypothetical protein